MITELDRERHEKQMELLEKEHELQQIRHLMYMDVLDTQIELRKKEHEVYMSNARYSEPSQEELEQAVQCSPFNKVAQGEKYE